MAVTKVSFEYTTETGLKSDQVSVIIVCGGSSSRMNGVDKMFAKIGGMPVAARTISAFEQCEGVNKILVVVKKDNLLKMQQLCDDFKFKKVTDIVEGGNCRQRSVANGLDRVGDDVSVVLVHDGARPFVSKACINRVIESAKNYNAATCAVKLKDTVKQIKPDGLVVATPDRNALVSVQTPQGFKTELYKNAVRLAKERLEDFTDDCSLVEFAGQSVYVVDGEYSNIKITTAEDLEYADFLLAKGEQL